MMKIKLGVFGIEIELTSGGGGVIRSDLKTGCPYCSKPNCFLDCDECQEDDKPYREELGDAEVRVGKNRVFDGIESLILAAACAGIDVGAPIFLQVIEDAVENNI